MENYIFNKIDIKLPLKSGCVNQVPLTIKYNEWSLIKMILIINFLFIL